MSSAVIGTLRAVLTLDTAQFEGASKQVSQSAKAWTKDLRRMGSQATAVGSSLTQALTVPLAGIGLGAAKLAMDFESSFAGIGKTVDGVTDSSGKLTAFGETVAQSFRNLAKELPVNVNELNNIGEAAGALGIPKDKIIDFTRVMAQLGVTTNLSSDQAANAVARIQNIFGAAGQDTDRLASTLVALGNAGASTESEIVEMAQRIAGAGHTVGLTQAQTLAFASTLASVGINAEAGGSAISRIFLKMNDAVMGGGAKLDEFARVAGVSSAEFKKAFEQDAAGAMVMFVNGLARLKGEGENTNATMEGMIGKNIILKDTLNRLTGSGKLLEDQIKLGGQAWAENTALTDEATKRFATTEAQMTLLWNRVQDLGITIGNALLPVIQGLIGLIGDLIPVIDTVSQWFADLPFPLQAAAIGFAAIVAAVGPVIFIVGQLLTAMSTITAAFATNGIAMTALSSLMPALGTAFTILTGPIGIAAAAIAALGVAWYTWGDDVTKIVKDVYAAVKEWLWDKLEPVLTPLGELLDSVGKMFEAFGKLVGAVVEKTYGIAKEFLLDKLGAAFESLKSIVQTVVEFIGKWVGKIPDVLLPLLGPIGAVVLAFRHWDEITRIAQTVYVGVKTWLIDKFTDIVNGIKAKVDAVTGFFKDMYDKVVGHSFVPDMIDLIGEHFGRLTKVMVDPTKAATADTKSFFSGMMQDVTALTERWIGDSLTKKFGTDLPDALKTGVDFAMKTVEGLFKGMMSNVDGFLGKWLHDLATGLPGLINGIVASATHGKVLGLDPISLILSYIGIVKDQGWSGEGTIPVPPGDDGTFHPPSGYFDDGRIDPGGPFGDQLRASMTEAEWQNYLDNYYSSAHPMADGGVVTGPTFAMIGEAGPEAVLPLSELASWVSDMPQFRQPMMPEGATVDARAWAAGGSFKGNVYMEGRLVGRAMFEPIVREAARQQVTQR